MPMPKGHYRSPDMVTVFELSHINGAQYNGDLLPTQQWGWPRSTWLKQRMALLHKFGLMKSAPSVTVAANQRRCAIQRDITLPSRKVETPRLQRKRKL